MLTLLLTLRKNSLNILVDGQILGKGVSLRSLRRGTELCSIFNITIGTLVLILRRIHFPIEWTIGKLSLLSTYLILRNRNNTSYAMLAKL